MAGVVLLGYESYVRPNDVVYPVVRVDPTDPWGIDFGLGLLGPGSFTKQTEVVLATRAPSTGVITGSWMTDFYNRVHLYPDQFAFGLIGADTAAQSLIWNAYLTPNTITDITEPSAGFGVTFVDAPALPFTLNAIGEVRITALATLTGVAAFNTTSAFTFSQGPIVNPIMSGERDAPLEFGPNWKDAMVETLTFQTEVVNISRSGKNQRRALRAEPRRSFTFTQTVAGRARRSLDGILARWRRRPQYANLGAYRRVLTALDPYRVKLTAQVDPGDLVVPFEGAAPSWLLPGQQVHFRHFKLIQNRVGTISIVNANSFVLVAPMPVSLPAGAQAIVMAPARLADGTKVTRYSDDAQDVAIALDVTPGEDVLYVPPAAPSVFAGYELFDAKPNWTSSLDVTWQHPLEEVDFGRGVTWHREYIDFAGYVIRMSYNERREAKVRDIVDLFWRQRGKCGEFWLPTWSDDMKMKVDMLESDPVMRIGGTDLFDDYSAQTTHQAIYIQFVDGTVATRKVIGFSTVSDAIGDDTTLTLDAAFGSGLTRSSIRKISWLMRVSFATDQLRLEWVTDEVANIQLTFQTLEAL